MKNTKLLFIFSGCSSHRYQGGLGHLPVGNFSKSHEDTLERPTASALRTHAGTQARHSHHERALFPQQLLFPSVLPL